jgi:argininosuccinate synthase
VIPKTLLVFSGSLEASALLKRLKETSPAPVVAFVPDLGQPEDGSAISRKASKLGADKVVIADLRDEFVRDYVFPALKANALFEGGAPQGAALARPLVAKVLVRLALSEGAGAAALPAPAPGLELALRGLAPELEILAPGRAELLAFAEARGLATDEREKTYAVEINLVQASCEGGPLEDPWAEPPAEIFRLSADPAKAPDEAEAVEIEFADGVPTAVNRESLAPAKLLAKLNALAGRHGVGRGDAVEPRLPGAKVRAAHEAPGASVLRRAHEAVEGLALDRELARRRDALAPDFAALVRQGFWFSPEMAALRAFAEESQKGVNGAARLKLFKGSASVVGRKSPHTLYNPELAEAGAYIRVSGRRLSAAKPQKRSPSCPS